MRVTKTALLDKNAIMKKLLVCIVFSARFASGFAPLANNKEAQLAFTLPRPPVEMPFPSPRACVKVA
jgi:hypothetical protein